MMVKSLWLRPWARAMALKEMAVTSVVVPRMTLRPLRSLQELMEGAVISE